jgi:hypothetical protein
MRRVILGLALGLSAFYVLAYTADWLQLQLREHRGSGHGSILVNHTDVVREKGDKVEYYSDLPQPTPCVRAIFPHEGESACWWLVRHIDEQQYLN